MDLFDFDGGDIFGTEMSQSDIDSLGVMDLDSSYNVAFMGSDSDSMIPDGRITLERSVSGIEDSFKVYRSSGHIYVETSPNNFVQVDGSGTVKIHGIEYDKI